MKNEKPKPPSSLQERLPLLGARPPLAACSLLLHLLLHIFVGNLLAPPLPPQRAERDDVSDDDQRRGLERRVLHHLGKRSQGCEHGSLVCHGSPLHRHRRGLGVHPVVHELAAHLRQRAQAHVDHDRGVLERDLVRELPQLFLGKLAPEVAGNELNVVRDAAVCERDAERGGDAARGCDPRDARDLHAAPLQVVQLLAAPAEDVGVTALQPDHSLAARAETVQQLMDLVLRPRVKSALLAHVDHQRVARRVL
mmetsp:Transcript_9639/g.29336  ORF Transcript_9639/g.29336 Transcript_9639/m.29336 type:complete len:252 (+) Transcript_9639:23-778(+)